MSWLNRLWRWLKKNWKWVAGGVTLIILALLGASYKLNVKKAELTRNKIKVLKGEREVARLEGQRDVIRRQETDVQDNIDAIDQLIEKKNEEIKNSHIVIDKMTAEQKLKKFKELGY